MVSKCLIPRLLILMLLVGISSSVYAAAGSAVIGSVAGSTNATLGGAALIPDTTIFSGDSLQVKEGVAVVAIGRSTRMVLGRETVASFLGETNQVTVLLSQGNVSLYHPDDSVTLHVKVGNLSIAPAEGFKTLGDVAMVNGALVVTAKEGMLRVEDGPSTIDVAKGKTLTVPTKAARSPASPVLAAGAGGLSTAMSVGSVAAGGLSAVLAGVAISHANSAKDAATAAGATAAQADADAQAATAAARTGTAAANAATAAANAAQATALSVGCALNTLAIIQRLPTSPFTPPAGSSCP